MAKEIVSKAIANGDQSNHLLASVVAYASDPTIKGLVLLNPDGTKIAGGGAGTVTGTGTTNYIPKWSSASALGNSLIYDDGTNVGIGITPTVKLDVNGSTTLRGTTGNFTWNNATDLLTLSATGAGGTNGLMINNSTTSTYVGIGFNSNNSQIAELGSGFSNGALVGPAFGTFTNNANGLVFAAYNAAGYIDFVTGGLTTTERRMRILANGNVGMGLTAATALLHIKAGTATANTAPLKLTSGALNTTAEAGAIEFLTDAYYATITTGAARKTFAFLESPVLTGNPTAPTQSAGDNSTKIATTAYTDAAVIAGTVGLLDYRGSYNASTNLFPATGGSGIAGAVLKGDFWICSVSGTLGGVATTPGDLIIATTDTPAQTAANWDIIAHNLGSYVTSVAGTTNRITSSGGATPAIDVSATFEALLGKVANPLSQFAVSTSAAIGVGSIELGHATDTTISRVSAGVISVEGVTVSTASNALTLTNKTITSSTNVLGGVTMTLGSDASYDLYYRGSGGLLTRLANGTTGQVLSATTSAAPAWAAASGGGITANDVYVLNRMFL